MKDNNLAQNLAIVSMGVWQGEIRDPKGTVLFVLLKMENRQFLYTYTFKILCLDNSRKISFV